MELIYPRRRYVGGPRFGGPTAAERRDALRLRLAELRAERQQAAEDLTWDRVGSDD